MDTLTIVVAIVALIALFAQLAFTFGEDTRDGFAGPERPSWS